MGKLVQQTGAEHARLNRDHGRIGRAVELPVQASFSNVLRLNSIVFRNSAWFLCVKVCSV